MTAAKSFEVSLLGDVNIDILMQIPFYPPPGGDGIAENVTIQAGGSAANTAVVLSRLGVGTQLLARVGSDPWAEMALSALRGQGVGLDGIQRDPQVNTGLINLTVTPDGERTMFSYRGANARQDPGKIDPGLVVGSRLLHLSGYAFLESPQSEAAQRAVRIARDNSIPISLDIGVEPARAMGAALTGMLPRLDLLVLGLDEARTVTGETGRDAGVGALLDRGVRRVALKLGKDGCLLAERSRWELVPGFSVPTVDSTGAGDAFSAGLLFARLKDMDLLQAGLLANALGALATTRWGGGVAFPQISEVIDLVRQQMPREEPLRSASAGLLNRLEVVR